MEGKPLTNFRRKHGFKRASSLVANRIRTAGETRGFAVSRLLTHWDDVVGADLSGMARPIEITYGKSFGATLTLLVKGAEAPMVEMQKESIRERVNACYGYAAIQKVRLTQTAPRGFAEAQAGYATKPKTPQIAPEAREMAAKTVEIVGDTSLRDALERLGANVLSQSKQK